MSVVTDDDEFFFPVPANALLYHDEESLYDQRRVCRLATHLIFERQTRMRVGPIMDQAVYYPSTVFESPIVPIKRVCRFIACRILEWQLREKSFGRSAACAFVYSGYPSPPPDRCESISDTEQDLRALERLENDASEDEEDDSEMEGVEPDLSYLHSVQRDAQLQHDKEFCSAAAKISGVGLQGGPTTARSMNPVSRSTSPAGDSVVTTSCVMERDISTWDRTFLPIPQLHATTEWMDWQAGDIHPLRTLFEMSCSLSEEIRDGEERNTEMRKKLTQLLSQIKVQMALD
ncbi:hypothetical protein D9619_006030 [Psilocybe cf. subviscida]|uniref:Uncharacterized protein n=1 Tax=Psilocybe cf. subviscida TaxID=2480587 RepID=A0A8H5BXN6_9AGAR|nr:hypothetical protein D9619_006030 [Psilocybe cf. subviscida]